MVWQKENPMKISVVVILIAVLTSGCATRLAVTYESNPPGAMLYEEGSRALGFSPFTAYYNITPDQRSEGVMQLSPITARWSSGATKTTGIVTANIRANGYKQKLKIARPADVPGYEEDLAFAQRLLEQRLQLLEARATVRAAQAQQNAALLLMLGTVNQQDHNNSRQPVFVPGCTGRQYAPNAFANPYKSANKVNNFSGKTGYQHGWKVYEKPQLGYIYSGAEVNPYGPGGSKSYGPGGGRSYGPGGGRSYGPGGGRSYGPGGGNSYGPGGGKNLLNPWTVTE
jgi:hypothetical protein